MARWTHIAYQYFHLQLSHPDCVIIARQADRLVGVLLASSPDNQPPFFTSLREMLGMRWLLGSVFSESQRIAQNISNALPHAPVWYINQLAIDPALQHQRLGSGLLARLAEVTGTGPVYVDCESVLEGFYSGAGFKVSCRPRAIDLIVMAKNA
jgi:ribosomal protein S18 acetylase RimI-like enzyme